MKKAFIVQILGAWGRGQTIPEAAKKCMEMGGRRRDIAVVDLILGDDTPELTNSGMNMLLEEGAEIVRIGRGFTLGQLLNIKV